MINALKWVYENRAMVTGSVWMVVSAAIVTMPEPGTKFTGATFYEWLYDALHQFSNLRRAPKN